MSHCQLIFEKKAMPITILKNNQDAFASLVGQLKIDRLQDHLVLVLTVHDKRLLQTDLAACFQGLVPKVEVLSHQLAKWLKIGVCDVSDMKFLTPRERRFALAKWNQVIRRGYSESQLEHMHEVLSWIHLHGAEVGSLKDVLPEMGLDLIDFTEWCTINKWIDRSSLYQTAHQVPVHGFDQPNIHLFQLGRLHRQHALALDSMIVNGGAGCRWFLHRSSGRNMSTGLQVDPHDEIDALQPKRVDVRLIKALHGRQEVEAVMRAIKKQVADSDDILAFSDFVVLLANYEKYRPIIELAAAGFGVPISYTRGSKELGDPAVARLRTWLYLRLNDFLLDDVLQVYGDGIIPLLSSELDEAANPNLRTFSRFCKKYNIRTVDQLSSDLERAIAREIQSRNEGIRRKGVDPDMHPTDFEERHGAFYRSILGHLKEVTKHYSVAVQPLSGWLQWVKEMISSLGTLKNAELMAASKRLVKSANVGLSTVNRVGYDPELDLPGFAKVFDSLLDGSLQVSQHPSRVLVGSVEDLTYLKDKRVFILGMSDSNFPVRGRSDDLFASVGEAGASWARALENDPLESASGWLASVAEQATALCLSHIDDGSSTSAMPSVFVTDTAQLLPSWDVSISDELADNRCFDKLDWMMWHRSRSWDPEQDTMYTLDLASLSRHVSAVTRLRESPSRISVWDGMLAGLTDKWAEIAKEVVSEAIHNLKKEGVLRISVSQLDAFAASPLEYFFRRLLRLEPPTEYLDEAEQSKKGTLLHEILDRFYSDPDTFGGIVDPVLDEEGARRRIFAISEAVFMERPEDLGNPETPFPEMLKRQIERTLHSFVDAEHEGLKQIHPEMRGYVRPATLRDQQTGDRVTEVPFEYGLDVNEEHVVINGFIDRIDTSADGSVQIIVDYKTGSTYSVKQFDAMNAGMSFQLPVYLNARKGNNASRILAGYYHIELSKSGKDIRLKGMLGDHTLTSVRPSEINRKDNKGLMDTDRLSEFLELLQEKRIKPVVRLILAGRFHQSLTEPSEYSDFKRMSRWSKSVNELRKLTLLQGLTSSEEMLKRYYIKANVLDSMSDENENGDEE
jgi:hypothetical protein